MRSDAANKAYSKHAYAVMFCDALPLIQGFRSGIDSPSLWGVQYPLVLIQCSSEIWDEVRACSWSCRTDSGSGCWWFPGSSWGWEEPRRMGAAYVDLCAGSACWTNGQGLTVTCYLCSLRTRDTWPNSLLCGEIEVYDLILLSPPFCPWGAMHAELRRQILAAGQ